MRRWRNLEELFKEKRKKRIRIRDLVVLTAWALGGMAPRREYIHKLLYIISRNREDLSLILGFEDYKRGPWSEVIADITDSLVDEGILDYVNKGVVLRRIGAVEEARSRINSDLIRELREQGKILSNLELDELLLYTYVLYGGASVSEVRDKILKRRKELAVSMLQKGVVSVGLAAKLAGMKYRDFIMYLKKKRIKPFVAEEKDVDKARKAATSTSV